MEPLNTDILVRKGLITAEQLAEARRQKLTATRRLSDVLVEMGFLSREHMVEHLFVQLFMRIKEVLEPLRDLERAIGDLYGACADLFRQEDPAFWTALKEEEEGHAWNIEEMISIVYARPQAFDLGLPIRREAIQTFLEGVRTTRRKIEAGAMTREQVLIAVRDIERGLIESRYFDVLKSGDPDFNRFLGKLRAETFGHRSRLENLR